MKPQPSFVVTALMLSLVGVGSWSAHRASAQVGICVGDCNGDGSVTVDELVTGINIALDRLPLERCASIDLGGDRTVDVAEVVTAVNNALAGCGSQANHAPHANAVSFSADTTTPYVEKQLIGSDPDDDAITYELIADDAGAGYDFAYLNPESGVLYVTLAAGFQGTIVLPYRVTDGRLFSNSANVTLQVQAAAASRNGGVEAVDPEEYAGYPRGFYNGNLLGAPGLDPTLPTAVDLTADFPRPGDQGQQGSCVGWALGYAIKTYQESVELGWSLEPAEHRFSPAYIYNQLNGGRDQGTRYRDALDLVVDQGVATLARMPYDEHDFLTQPSDLARQEASQFKVKSWDTANGILEIKDALANHLGVMLILQEFEDMWYLAGPNAVYNTFARPWSAQHAVAAVGYDDGRYGGALRVINSWGENWGDGGYFWLPYSAANQTVNTPTGQSSVLIGAVVLQDMSDPNEPLPDPVDPPVPGDMPDLQVTNWQANFNGTPGGSGSLQYTVTNTGTATAPAGSYVALIVSRDPTFKSSNTLVVYEPIPFDMPPGTTAYRDANNTIAFRFPNNLEPGQYYMALWADIWDAVVESYETNNISAAAAPIDIVNTLPDMQVVTWYSAWDELGLGSLTYDVVNNGASTAPAGWQIALALSPNEVFGDGDEILLFSEPASFDLAPGGTLYRSGSAAARFSLYFDRFGNPVPDGVYYIALWLDPTDWLAESNEFNNASLSWGTIGIGVAGVAARSDRGTASFTETGAPISGEAYNGKHLPEREGAVRKVQISTGPEGGRRMDLLGAGAAADSGPRVKAAESQEWSKVARARQQVIFPVAEMKPMPGAH
jgi:hypothetical protein